MTPETTPGEVSKVADTAARRHGASRIAAALAVAVVAGLVPSGAQAATRAAGVLALMPADDPVAEIRDLKRRADAASAEIERATRAYAAGRAKLAMALRRLERTREEERQARSELAAERFRLDSYVNAIYKNPTPPTVMLLAMTGDEPTDVLRAAEDLQHIAAGQSQVVGHVEELSRLAEEKRATAERLAAQTRVETKALLEKRRELVTRSKQLSDELADAVRKLAARGAEAGAAVLVACDGKTILGVGDFPNGLLPASTLCRLPNPMHKLRGDAAAAFWKLNAAYRSYWGSDICITDSYRSLATQQRVFAEKPGLAAIPGRSNHGWGLAVDLCGGLQSPWTPQTAWMRKNAPQFGWVHPTWADPNGSKPEAWHWEYALSLAEQEMKPGQ